MCTHCTESSPDNGEESLMHQRLLHTAFSEWALPPSALYLHKHYITQLIMHYIIGVRAVLPQTASELQDISLVRSTFMVTIVPGSSSINYHLSDNGRFGVRNQMLESYTFICRYPVTLFWIAKAWSVIRTLICSFSAFALNASPRTQQIKGLVISVHCTLLSLLPSKAKVVTAA